MKRQQLLFVVRHYNRKFWRFDFTNAIGTDKARTKFRLIFSAEYSTKAFNQRFYYAA